MRATIRLPVRLAVLVSTIVVCTAPAAWAQFSSDNCTVSVLNRSVRVNPDGSWVLPNIPANFGLVRARVTCIVDEQTISGESEPFLVPANGVVNLPHITFGATTRIPTALTLTAAPATLAQAGGTSQLTTTAHYSDGTTKDVTAASTGTQYTISNPAIATISADGVVTAVQSGTVLVQATQEGASGIISVAVVLDGESHQGIPDSWATQYGLNPSNPTLAAEDPDRDGLTNLQEFQLGTNPTLADTDSDGLSDGDEVTRGTSPLLRDTDGDGISDGLEVQTGSDPLNPASFNLAAALSTVAIAPSPFTVTFNTVAGDASVQLRVTGTLRDGTAIDLTPTQRGTNYTSSDLTICNFGASPGRVFAGLSGNCLITATVAGFVATASGTVHTFTPTPLSFVNLPGPGNGVDVSGSFVYVAAGAAGLQVIDSSNHSSPHIVASLLLLGTANDVKLAGTFAYVAAGAAGLHVIDVSNPVQPHLLGSVDTPGSANDVRVRGNLAFVADGSGGLQVIDVSVPGSPRVVGSVPTSAPANGVDVTATLAIVAVGGAGVQVVSIQNPANPFVVGAVDTPGDAQDVVVRGNFAYVADNTGSLRVVDFSAPTAPILGGTTPPSLGGILFDVTSVDSFVFGADIFFVNGVPIIDVTTPTNPIPRAILNFSQFRDDNGAGIAADVSYVYLGTFEGRLYIGQYRIQEDLNGIPPAVSITSPAAGSTFVEGEAIPVSVTATDDLAVAAVSLQVNGGTFATDTAPPYQFTVMAPAGVTALALGATAADLGNNVGTAAPVVVNIIPDPLTTVTGRVVLQNGAAAGGATIQCASQAGSSLADGSFTITSVPTVQPTIACSAASVSGTGVPLRGHSNTVQLVRFGVTAIGDLVIAPVPVIASITPKVIDSGAPPSTLQVTGANFVGAAFSFAPLLQPPAVTVGPAQISADGTTATLPITVAASARGRFTLLGTNTFGGSDTTPTAGNTLTLINAQDDADSDGDGFPDGLELLFGSDPANSASIPSLTTRGDVRSATVSVSNTALPPTQVQLTSSAAFSVSNTQLPSSTIQTLVSSAFSVVNTVNPATGSQTLVSPAFSVANTASPATGSQALAGSAVSVLNNASPSGTQQISGTAVSVLNAQPGSQQAQQLLASAQKASVPPLSVSLSGLTNGQTLVEGQTITVGANVQGSVEPVVTFSVNGVPLVTDARAPFEMTFTVPAGVPSLRFGAAVADAPDKTASAPTIEVGVERDITTSVSGRVVDAAGNPVAGATVELVSDGLRAEFFDSATPLTSLPDLTGANPVRSTRVTAVNMRGPNGVFGNDPFAAGLAPDYAARFTGWLTISNPGTHTFYLGADEGARLRVGGVTVVDMPSPAIGGYQEKSATVNLDAGLVPVEITFYESVGNAQLQLSLAPPGGEREVVAPSLLVPNSSFVVVTDAEGRFTIPSVPIALQNVQVRASVTRNGQTTSVTSDRVTVSKDAIQAGDIALRIPR